MTPIQMEEAWQLASTSHGSAQLSPKAAFFKGIQHGKMSADFGEKAKDLQPRVLTYEALACEEGLELLDKLFPNEEYKPFEFEEEKAEFSRGHKKPDVIGFHTFKLNGDHMFMNVCNVQWQHTLLNTDLDPSSPTYGQNLGHMFKGEQTIFVPKV